MVDQIESAVSLSTFNFLFSDPGENFETAEPVEMALPELPTMDIQNEYLAFCDSHTSTKNLRKHLHLDPALQPSHRPLNSDDGSYYEMQHLKAQYQNLEKHLDCLSQTLQSVQDEYGRILIPSDLLLTAVESRPLEGKILDHSKHTHNSDQKTAAYGI